MGGGLADHELAVAATGGGESSHASEDEFEPWEVSHPPATPPSQESVQPLPPSSYPTMGGGLVDHELAADGIARNEPWTKRDFDMFTFRSRAHAEASQRSGVHTRFADDGVDQASVSVVS